MSAASRRERILPRLIEEEMRESFLDYSMSVIVQRALPDVRDGLKPVHRRILYAMHQLGLQPDRPYKKSATVVGDVLGKYHPHGDAAVYDALVRMVQDFSLRYPLIDGQGNFGSLDGDAAAAYRYTEAKLASIATELLDDIERETVDFGPNFDDQRQEPLVLPGRLPGFLVNGSSGIAVGMSTNAPPHNLREVARGIRMLTGEEDCSVDDLMGVIPGPDFPTGGLILGRDGIESMYRTGRGRVVMRARVVGESLRGGKQQLVVTELPYTVSKSRVVQQIAELARRGTVEEISDLRDESDRDGLRVVIELKRGADAAAVLKVLFRKTHLQSTFGAIVLALDHGEPKEFNLKEVLERYRDHRLDVIRRRSRHDLEKAEAERHVVEGLLAALADIDAVIRIIRRSKDRSEAADRLQARLGLSEVQANAILDMRLARLTALEQVELEKRLGRLGERISELRAILKSEARQVEVLLEELDELVERYGDERRTEILDEAPRADAPVEAAVADEDVVVTVSHRGYVKRIPMHLYRRRVRSGKALAGMERYDDDFLERVFVARSSGWILCFTQGGQAYYLPVMDVPEGARSSRGQSLYSLLSATRSDPVVALVPVEDLESDEPLVFVTAGGLVKRTSRAEFSNPRAGGVAACGVRGGDRVLEVAPTDGESEIMLFTSAGRAIRFPEQEVSLVGRTAQGVKGVDLKGDATVVGVLVIRRDANVLTVTEDGMGKRTPVQEFPLQKRGGMGTMALPGAGDDAPALVAALEVVAADHLLVTAASGASERIDAASVPVQGRRTRGTRLVDLGPGDRVVEVSRSEEEGSGGEGGEGGEGPVGADTEVEADSDPDAPRPAEAQPPKAGGNGAGQLDLLGR